MQTPLCTLFRIRSIVNREKHLIDIAFVEQRIAAQILANYIGKQGKVYLFSGMSDQVQDKGRRTGFRDRIREHYPNITVQAVDGNYRYAAAASLDGGFVGGDFTLDGCFEAEFSAYYETLTGDSCADYNDFIAPVFIMNAMYRALQSGKEESVLRAERI